MTLADLLTSLRLERGLSQEELAERTGVSVRTISNLERGATAPRRATMRALSAGLRLDRQELHALGRATSEDGAAGTGTLPARVSSIVGRDEYVARVSRTVLRGRYRVVCVLGPGGVGKSRAALEVAWQVASKFHRVDAVDASTLEHPDDLGAAFAGAVGCPPESPPTPESVATRIGDRRWLVLLESAEHVPATADLVRVLLEQCPGLRLLVTSRSALGLAGEVTIPLGPLPVPGPSSCPEAELLAPRTSTVEELVANPSVALLAARVTAVRPDFAVTSANAAAVASICRRLDGLPLAIELVAGQLQAQDPAAVDGQLAGRALELRADLVDLPGRHRTLRATVEWSTERLPERDRLVLAVLGAFRGGAARAALWAVAGSVGLSAAEVDAGLVGLTGASLVTVTGERVTMLDTIREIAADLLVESGAADRVRAAHARYLLELVTRAGSTPEGYAAIDSDIDNVRAAVDHAVSHLTDEWTLSTVDALAGYLTARARFGEIHRRLGAIGDVAGDDAARAGALLHAGIAANHHGDHAAALKLAERAAQDGGRDLHCRALNLIGAAYKSMGDLASSRAAYQRCLAAAEATGDARYLTVALNNLGAVAHDEGEYDLARRYYQRSLAIKRRHADAGGVVAALVNLGWLHKDLGEYALAGRYLMDAARRSRTLNQPHVVGFSLALLAEAHAGAAELPEARAAADEAAEIGTRIGQPQIQCIAVAARGDIAYRSNQPAEAAAQYRVALDLAREPFDVARLTQRLALVVGDPAQAQALRAEADAIRREHGFVATPADRAFGRLRR